MANRNAWQALEAPFPWFGGKSSAAHLVWERFGRVSNYVDPFCGSLAVPLRAPYIPKTETVNDADGLLVNFWRAVSAAPDEVAAWTEWPKSEIDLHARHAFLLARKADLVERLIADVEFFDAQLAGWWVWGACAWIGRGWCGEGGAWRQIPHITGSCGIYRSRSTTEWLGKLKERTRRMRITCGDWRRVLTPSAISSERLGPTGILLDPPYTEGSMAYAGGSAIAAEVAEWARDAGGNSKLRIALCGHVGEHEMPGWDSVRWVARGGYGNQGSGDNRHRETIWFSPHCLQARQATLFLQPELTNASSTGARRGE